MSSFSGKKILLLGIVVVLMVVIPLTVYLVQQQQKLRVGAEKASRLFFFNQTTQDNTASITKPGETANLEVWLDPATNQVSFVKLVINYDATKLSVKDFTPNATDFPTTLQQPDKGNGKATVTLSVGSSADKIVKTKTKVATISFNALQTATAGSIPISFDTDPTSGTQVLSIAGGDQFNENVLLTPGTGTITIAQSALAGGSSPTLTPTPSPTPVGATPTPTLTPTPSPTPVGATPTPTPTPTASPSPTPQGVAGGGGAGAGTGTSQIAVVATPSPTPIPTTAPGVTPLPGTKGGLPAAGPGDRITSFGALGILSVIIGALLLFGL